MSQTAINIEERVGQLNRFLTGPGGFPHCCAIMVFDRNLKLTFTSPMVARVFGTTYLEHQAVFFNQVFSGHEQLALKKLQQHAQIKEDWAEAEVTINHQSRQISRQLQASCLMLKEGDAPSFVYVFCTDDNSQNARLFFNLFKRAVKFAPNGLAKLSLHKGAQDALITNQRFEFFDNGFCTLLDTPRAELLNASMVSLIPQDQIAHNECIWGMALNGYIDGYTYYTELLNTSGQVICVRITPFILTYSESYRDYLLMFTEVEKDPFFQSGNTFDALTAGLSHANIALAIIEDNLITLANEVFLALVPPLRRDGRDPAIWLNEISPEYRKSFRKQWERGVRRLQPFTVELTLKSDRQTSIYLTVVPRQQKVGENVTTKFFLLGKLQDTNFIHMADSRDRLATSLSVSADKPKAKELFGLLTKTERRVASLIRKGWSSKDIARELDISPGTVNIHRKNIRRKLNLTGEKVNLSRALALLSFSQPT